MENPSIKTPDWFKKKDYNTYKKLSTKEICVEIEIRRFQIQFLKNGVTLSNYYLDTLKRKFPLISISEIKSNLLDKLIAITREDFQFNSYNYNNSKSDFYYTILGFILSEHSKIINKSNAVEKLQLKDIHQNYMVPRDIVMIYELYSYSNIIDEFEDINMDKLKSVNKEYYQYRKNELPILLNEHDFYKGEILSSLDDGYSDYLNYSYTESLIPMSNNFFSMSNQLFKNTDHNSKIPTVAKSELHLNIDINAANETIIEQVVSLVEQKREMYKNQYKDIYNMSITDKKSGGFRIIKTLIEQRIIQYLDLYIWNLENNKNPTSDWYMQAIYQDKILKKITLQHSKMNDTIKPTAKKWLNEEWLGAVYQSDIPSYNEIIAKN